MDSVHHFRDLLIAVEAARAGATVITENVKTSNVGELCSRLLAKR
jgi:hypothetical protein